jgi:hypothetical protein
MAKRMRSEAETYASEAGEHVGEVAFIRTTESGL